MEIDKLVTDTVTSILSSLAQKGANVTVDKVQDLKTRLTDRDPELEKLLDIDALVSQIVATDVGGAVDDAYTEENLARYLEIPVRDLSTFHPETIELDVIVNHVKLCVESDQFGSFDLNK